MRKLTKPLSINIETVDINKMRYGSIDDYSDPLIYPSGIFMNVKVGNMGNTDYEFLVGIHALIESYLCFRKGITDKEITKFDMEHTHCDDPGSHKEAIYHYEHHMAERVERMLSYYLGVSWEKYGKAIDKTLKKYKKK